MELGHGTGVIGLQVLQIEAPYQIVVTPDVFGDKMDLRAETKSMGRCLHKLATNATSKVLPHFYLIAHV